jgi:hypothetical protein
VEADVSLRNPNLVDARMEIHWFVKNLRSGGPRKALSVLVHNVRFQVGYAIGGFTSAKRDY